MLNVPDDPEYAWPVKWDRDPLRTPLPVDMQMAPDKARDALAVQIDI
jgi:hypothetical protein